MRIYVCIVGDVYYAYAMLANMLVLMRMCMGMCMYAGDWAQEWAEKKARDWLCTACCSCGSRKPRRDTEVKTGDKKDAEQAKENEGKKSAGHK
jgi:hypothetical protein